jgi:hypothetical protein
MGRRLIKGEIKALLGLYTRRMNCTAQMNIAGIKLTNATLRQKTIDFRHGFFHSTVAVLYPNSHSLFAIQVSEKRRSFTYLKSDLK